MWEFAWVSYFALLDFVFLVVWDGVLWFILLVCWVCLGWVGLLFVVVVGVDSWF